MNFRFKDFPQLSFGLSHVQKTNDRNEREKTKYTKRTVENKTSSETRKYAKMREMFVYCESTSQQTDWQGIVLAYTQPTCTPPSVHSSGLQSLHCRQHCWQASL